MTPPRETGSACGADFGLGWKVWLGPWARDSVGTVAFCLVLPPLNLDVGRCFDFATITSFAGDGPAPGFDAYFKPEDSTRGRGLSPRREEETRA